MLWSLKLSAFHYIIEHVPGEKNVWADMLSRWAVELMKSVASSNAGRVSALMVAPIKPRIDKALDCPSMHSRQAPKNLPKEEKP